MATWSSAVESTEQTISFRVTYCIPSRRQKNNDTKRQLHKYTNRKRQVNFKLGLTVFSNSTIMNVTAEAYWCRKNVADHRKILATAITTTCEVEMTRNEFELLPTLMQSISMFFHSHSQYYDLFPFPPHSQNSIPILSHCHSQFVCHDSRRNGCKTLQDLTNEILYSNSCWTLNTSSDVKRSLAKNTLSMSPFTESRFSCHFCILLCRNSKLFVESALKLVRRLAPSNSATIQTAHRWELFPMGIGLFPFPSR